jgi:hypothetical protein
MSWAEFEARITSTPIKKFFQGFPPGMQMELWKSSWIHMLPPLCPIVAPEEEKPLVYVVALGVLQLQIDPDSTYEPSPFALKPGTRVFPGDAVTTDDLRRATAVAVASADSDALALELDRSVYLRLLNAVRNDHADRIRAFVVTHILPQAGAAAPASPAIPESAPRALEEPSSAAEDKALAHLVRIFALRRVVAGSAVAQQGAAVDELLWVERGACVAVVAFGPRHCTAASAPGVPAPGGTSRRYAFMAEWFSDRCRCTPFCSHLYCVLLASVLSEAFFHTQTRPCLRRVMREIGPGCCAGGTVHTDPAAADAVSRSRALTTSATRGTK